LDCCVEKKIWIIKISIIAFFVNLRRNLEVWNLELVICSKR